jgi:hypothetical protein
MACSADKLTVRNILANDNYKIDIAVDIKVANCKGTLQICADEVVTQRIANPRNEITQDGI